MSVVIIGLFIFGVLTFANNRNNSTQPNGVDVSEATNVESKTEETSKETQPAANTTPTVNKPAQQKTNTKQIVAELPVVGSCSSVIDTESRGSTWGNCKISVSTTTPIKIKVRTSYTVAVDTRAGYILGKGNGATVNVACSNNSSCSPASFGLGFTGADEAETVVSSATDISFDFIKNFYSYSCGTGCVMSTYYQKYNFGTIAVTKINNAEFDINLKYQYICDLDSGKSYDNTQPRPEIACYTPSDSTQ